MPNTKHLNIYASRFFYVTITIFCCHLTFIGPCIAIIFPKYNQQDITLLNFIYIYKTLYMFQAVPPPIIRRTKLYIQLQVLSNNTAASCYRGWDGTPWSSISSMIAASSSICWKYLKLHVQFSAPDDDPRYRLKYVEHLAEINKIEKCCILLVVIWEHCVINTATIVQ